MKLQDRIKLLRDEKGLTQKELASYLQVDRATISGYETKGKQPDLEKLIKMAKLFEVTLDYLIKGQETNPHRDFLGTTGTEELLDNKIYQIYTELSFHSKKQVHQFMNYLHYSQIRPSTDETE